MNELDHIEIGLQHARQRLFEREDFPVQNALDALSNLQSSNIVCWCVEYKPTYSKEITREFCSTELSRDRLVDLLKLSNPPMDPTVIKMVGLRDV